MIGCSDLVWKMLRDWDVIRKIIDWNLVKIGLGKKMFAIDNINILHCNEADALFNLILENSHRKMSLNFAWTRCIFSPTIRFANICPSFLHANQPAVIAFSDTIRCDAMPYDEMAYKKTIYHTHDVIMLPATLEWKMVIACFGMDRWHIFVAHKHIHTYGHTFGLCDISKFIYHFHIHSHLRVYAVCGER